MEQTWQILQQGLQSYCKKNNFKNVILGLSGGLDSALTAVLAADVLGGKNVLAIMMKTRYTSELSLKIARQTANLNQLEYLELDIEPLVQNNSNFLKQALQEKPQNLTLENLQSRIRGQILMAFSNQRGGLVLACSNKSEALSGYCTLYGDTCGGLMPMGNLYKTTIFKLAKWRNSKERVLPEEVISRPPTAELAFAQKDEDSLPPYPVLDAILQRLFDKKKTIDEVCKEGFERSIVEKVNILISHSAFKRRQMAASLPID